MHTISLSIFVDVFAALRKCKSFVTQQLSHFNQKKSAKNLFFNNLSYLCVINFKQNNNMKKIILSAVAIMAFGFANAQDKKEGSFGFAKGDIYLGGRVAYSSDDNETGGVSVKTTSTTLAPEAGYFISDDFAITLGVAYKTVDNGATKPNSLDVNVGGRYYFLPLGERFKTFTNFGVGFGSSDPDTGGDKTSNFHIGGGLGINYFITPRLAIDFGLSDLLMYRNSKTGDDKSTTIDLSLNEYNNFFGGTATFGLIYKL